MKEFDKFLRTFFSVQLTFFFVSVALVLILTGGDVSFLASFIVGYSIMFVDYFLLIKFSRQVPEKVFLGKKTGSQFWKRFFIIALLLLLVAQFTSVDFFAIILAVAIATSGVAVSAVKFRKEWEGCRSTEA
ncbi:hypothetical protein [Phorcysia thermohydrogeniphila]|uniref:ATP synthase I subunit n=1 Tax=Phorcysia thermohydrogeniphila TaxID=936138 RepID=A0A4R1G8L7_9BACT|nr:hypothetical protein [Phorcysia thermohydrogeniphila]TCK03958.1 hypothetical protein CLV27_1275 [Phorcysia thermohydrogeniphila]